MRNNSILLFLGIFILFLVIEVIMDVVLLPADEVLIPADIIFDALMLATLFFSRGLISSPRKEVR